MNQYLILCKTSGRPKVLDSRGFSARSAKKGCPLFLNIKDPYLEDVVPGDLQVRVVALPQEKLIPAPRLSSMMIDSIEEFRVHTGLASDPPGKLTCALFMEFDRGLPKSHELIVGGPKIEFCFNLGLFFGHDKRDVGGAMVRAYGSVDPSEIRFRPGSNVTPWTPIYEQFKDSLSTPGCAYDWAAEPAILTRWKISADESSNEVNSEAKLVLEAIIVPEGDIIVFKSLLCFHYSYHRPDPRKSASSNTEISSLCSRHDVLPVVLARSLVWP